MEFYEVCILALPLWAIALMLQEILKELKNK
jgi:hypothetical protein